MDGRKCIALVATLALLFQAGVPTVLAHGGEHDGSEDSARANQSGGQLTPDRSFANQRNPDMDGPRVVWQERTPGEDFEIAFANVSQSDSAVSLTNNDREDTNPVVEGDHVAWLSDHGSTSNIVVLDLETGRIQHVPDTGGNEDRPTFGGNETLYYRVGADGGHEMRGFDLETGEVFRPIGGRQIVGSPAAHGSLIGWAEGSKPDAKLHILDTETQNLTEVPHLYTLQEGPQLGPAGLAWIARYGGEFTRGQYTAVYNLTTGLDKKRSNVYPHTQLEVCNTGVIWNQPGTSTTDQPTVALWDRFVDGIVTFGSENYQGTCGADHVVYEATTRGEDSGSETRKLFIQNLETVRLPRDASIEMKPDDQRSLLRAQETLEGTIQPGDPREPVQRVLVQLDGSGAREANTESLPGGGLAWSVSVDPRPLEPGRHELTVTAVNDLGRRTSESFTFYTETPYDIEQAGGENGPNVPTESSAPFPLNLLNHYQEYQPFYNTVILVLVILAAIGWFAYKRYTSQPTGQPEYVPPDEIG